MKNIQKNFIYKDQKQIELKLNGFKNAGKNKICLIVDFDQTITPFANEKGEEVSTWGLLSRKLPLSIRNAEIELYKKYRPLELAGKMTIKDALDWWSINLDYYEKSELSWTDLALEVEDAIPARPGTAELFSASKDKKIPIIILSAGIKDVIELWCQKFKLYPEMILSTKLYFDEKGFISGWDKDSLVHTLNKKEIGKKYLGTVQKERQNTILIGNSMDDAAMVGGTDNVLRIFIDNHQNREANSQNPHENVFQKFDLIVKNGSLHPVAEIIKSIQ